MVTLGLVLDANILIRAVLGKRVLGILERYEDAVRFYCPDTCYEEARKHLPTILQRRGIDAAPALTVLENLKPLVQPIDHALYQVYATQARARMAERDPDDWHIVALAMALNLPIWTEDQDFFGTGIATWTTDRVELYLQNAEKFHH